MAKKKKKKSSGTIIKIVCIFVIIAAIAIFADVGKQIYQTISLQHQKEVAEEQLQMLKDENASLTSTKTKLEDPNYVVTYAKGEYMFSKEDEKVFYLPSEE